MFLKCYIFPCILLYAKDNSFLFEENVSCFQQSRRLWKVRLSLTHLFLMHPFSTTFLGGIEKVHREQMD